MRLLHTSYAEIILDFYRRKAYIYSMVHGGDNALSKTYTVTLTLEEYSLVQAALNNLAREAAWLGATKVRNRAYDLHDEKFPSIVNMDAAYARVMENEV